MDTTYGVLCLIPPIVAIGLALWTKQTIFSLFIAVWLGSTMMNGFNPLVGFVKIISDYVIPSLSGNASLIVLVTLSGGMIAMLRTTGASCNHVVHVMTQLPYGITVGISAFLGFLFGGLTRQYILSIVVTAVILVVVLFALTQLTKLRYPEKVH